MPQRIFIGVAWPYANGHLHLGQIAGCYLPADIFARFHRMKGNDVLMVSGSDQHGTPVTIRAEQEETTPQEVVDRYHISFLDSWERLGITFNRYTSTGTENHRKVVHDIFKKLWDKGYIYPETMELAYCERNRRFLPDRYVVGTCPFCGYERARGDQCEACGRPMNAQELLHWQCRLCGETPVLRSSEHLFFKLSTFQKPLLQWIEGKESFWRPNVYNFTRQWLADGLKDRAISRDIEWGVPIPLPGYEGKRIYVWFEAVIGYLSAAVEAAEACGEPERWRKFWQNPDCSSYYFIGKDNIPFHTIIWPAMLMGYGDYDGKSGEYNLPYNVPANEFLSLDGQKFSTSQNWAVWLPDYLERYPPDPLRYYLSANMPETGDSDFSWREFVRRNNDELVATYGNLVHRVLTLTYRNFDRSIPAPAPLDALSQLLLDTAGKTLEEVEKSLAQCHFRKAIGQAMGLARETNRYLDLRAPWRTLQEDREATATTLWVSLSAINCLKLLLYPFLPFSSEQLHTSLGFEGPLQEIGWQWKGTVDFLPPGQPLQEPRPLFAKLDEKVAEEEVARLSLQRR